jgi:pilus assembly protein Flp/PilA
MSMMDRMFAQVLTAVYGLKHNEEGQGLAEYGLILALVAVVVVGAVTTLGTNITTKINAVASSI